jgi:acetyl-CoA carboxylase biotin carboxyl carrier protein
MSSHLDLEKIKELMAALEQSDLTRLKLKIGETEIELAREERVAAAPPPPPPQPARVASEPKVVEQPTTSEKCIVSPMVGTFYLSPSPSDPAFVKAGDQVSEDSVVCIVEAMKVMNEVKAGVKGTIKRVMAENGQPVEFGAKLFEIV